MNDNKITTTISKIQFIVASIFSFILFILFALFFLLQHGLLLQNLSFADVKVEQLYIKWDEKIKIHAKEIAITSSRGSDFSLQEFQTLLVSLKPKLSYLALFQEIDLQKVTFDTLEAQLRLNQREGGFLRLTSPFMVLDGDLRTDGSTFELSLKECEIKEKQTKIGGTFLFETHNNLELTTALEIEISDAPKLRFYSHSDKEGGQYALVAEEKINNIKQIIKLFVLDPNLQYWVHDAITLSDFELEMLYGSFEYAKMEEAYRNLYAKGVAHDLTYTYDQALAPIRTQKTDLEFQDGVLFIYPRNAYSYDFFLDKSWLKIDFTQPQELLTLQLLFDGQVNENLLGLLRHYRVKLPFVQTQGMVDTNLTLAVNLMTSEITTVEGDFSTQGAQIHYLGLDIDILDAYVKLRGADVEVKGMRAAYQDIATAAVDLELKTKESSGRLDFYFENIAFEDKGVSWLKEAKPLHVSYRIDAQGDYLNLPKSKWNYKEHMLSIDATKVLFELEHLKARFPSTKFRFDTIAEGLFEGDLLLGAQEASFDLTLLKLGYEDIVLDAPKTLLKAHYKEESLWVEAQDALDFKIDAHRVRLDNAALSFAKERIQAKDVVVTMDEELKTKLTFDFNSKSGLGKGFLQQLTLQNDAFGVIAAADEKIDFAIEKSKEMIHLYAKEYGIDYLLDANGWFFNLTSLEKLVVQSPLLQKYNLDNGHLRLQKERGQKELNFWLQSDYKHKILIAQNEPIEHYTLQGAYDTHNGYAKAKLNEIVTIDIQDNIKIKAQNIGIHVDELLNFFDDNATEEQMESVKQDEQQQKDDSLSVFVEMEGCYLYLSENRSIISDTIHLQYRNETLHGELLHDKARANLLLKEKRFHLHGENFNDSFMEKLFANSKFRGGSMEFYISGPLKEYDGTIHIKETTILDYKILNNVLAFVNTVPSLVTFSLPGYNINGIKAKEAYVKLRFQDEKYKISDLYLDSKEIEIVGKGEASIKENSVDLDLNLKTQIGSSFSKIPLIGHILLGNETISTSLHVTGKLDDPEVETQVVKDIAIAPFNIIKRALMYPFEMFQTEDEVKH